MARAALPVLLSRFPTALTVPHGPYLPLFWRRGPHAQSLPLQPSGLLQREMSWLPRPAPPSSRSPPHGLGDQVQGVLCRVNWTRADPVRVAPLWPAAAGNAAGTARRGGAGTAGSGRNTVMTRVQRQEGWNLSPTLFQAGPQPPPPDGPCCPMFKSTHAL